GVEATRAVGKRIRGGRLRVEVRTAAGQREPCKDARTTQGGRVPPFRARSQERRGRRSACGNRRRRKEIEGRRGCRLPGRPKNSFSRRHESGSNARRPPDVRVGPLRDRGARGRWGDAATKLDRKSTRLN